MSSKALTKVQQSKKLWCLRTQTGKQFVALSSQRSQQRFGKTPHLGEGLLVHVRSQPLHHRGHNSNGFNLALVAHMHPWMLQSPRLLNSTNSLIFYHLLTIHLHNPMPHSSLSPRSLPIYQNASPGSVLTAEYHLLGNARCSVIMLCHFSCPLPYAAMR